MFQSKREDCWEPQDLKWWGKKLCIRERQSKSLSSSLNDLMLDDFHLELSDLGKLSMLC